MVNGKSWTNQCQKMGYRTWVATKIYMYIILTVLGTAATVWVEHQGSLQDILYIPAWSTICATQTRLLHTTVGPIHFSHSHSTILR